MTRCAQYYDKVDETGENFCGVDKSEWSRIKGYLKARDELIAMGILKEDIYEYMPAAAARDLITYQGEERKRALNIVADKIRNKQAVKSTQFFVKARKESDKPVEHVSNTPTGQPGAGKIAKEFYRTLPPSSQESIKAIMAQEKLELEDLLDIVISLGLDAYIKDLKGSE